MRALETCFNCRGTGQEADYGSGEDFYGPKECKLCGGSGVLQKRDAKGRFAKAAA